LSRAPFGPFAPHPKPSRSQARPNPATPRSSSSSRAASSSVEGCPSSMPARRWPPPALPFRGDKDAPTPFLPLSRELSLPLCFSLPERAPETLAPAAARPRRSAPPQAPPTCPGASPRRPRLPRRRNRRGVAENAARDHRLPADARGRRLQIRHRPVPSVPAEQRASSG
jgi:hypothetical protein